jgi:hypothetical protein
MPGSSSRSPVSPAWETAAGPHLSRSPVLLAQLGPQDGIPLVGLVGHWGWSSPHAGDVLTTKMIPSGKLT